MLGQALSGVLLDASVGGAGAKEGYAGVHAAVAGVGQGVGGHAGHLQLQARAWRSRGSDDEPHASSGAPVRHIPCCNTPARLVSVRHTICGPGLFSAATQGEPPNSKPAHTHLAVVEHATRAGRRQHGVGRSRVAQPAAAALGAAMDEGLCARRRHWHAHVNAACGEGGVAGLVVAW